jgi:type II secretory pathway component PulF
MAGTFRYVALDAGGKRSRGVVRAGSEQEAYRQLAADGLTPISVKHGESAAFSLGKKKITPRDISALTRELSVLVEARIPIARGLASIAEHESNPALRAMILDLGTMIESGKKITEALSKYKDEFGEVYIETMRAAEKSGSLGTVLEHLALMLDRQQETAQQMKRAMTYPVVVLAFVALAMSVIVIFVVPRFAAIFSQNGVKLPLTTQVVQMLGESIKAYWYVYGGAVAASVVGTVYAWRQPGGRAWFERTFLRLPYLGRVMLATTTARFSRVLSIGMGSGLDLVESIEIAGRSSGRPLFQAETARMAERLQAGDPLDEVLRATKYVPPFGRRMLAAGKDAKEMSSAADVVARHYDRESDHLAKNINTIIEPMMTLAMAAIVLLVALSVFLPMWEMIKINKR